MLGLVLIPCAEGGFAQTAPAAPPCRAPSNEDERALVATTKQTLASLDGFISELEVRLAEFEEALARPNAGPELLEVYRQTRLHLDGATAQRAEFAKLAAVWCDD